jgi:NADPH:quinone reductase-like Zn-dependent oxidoreductase
VGNAVTSFKVGDEVFGERAEPFAEYVCVPEHAAIVHKPPNITMQQAEAVPIAGVTALQAVRDHGRVRSGQKVLVNGAAGGVGTFAVQIARAFGGEVTAVCSTAHVKSGRAIGAQHVVDYTREDFTNLGQRFDLMLDIAGSRSFGECARVLAPTATFVCIGSAAHMQSGAWKFVQHVAGVRLSSLGSRRRAVVFIARTNRSDLRLLYDLMSDGKLTPVIDRRYPMTEVQAAFAYLGEGHAAGKVVLDT